VPQDLSKKSSRWQETVVNMMAAEITRRSPEKRMMIQDLYWKINKDNSFKKPG
jgi:hypothetical protein